VRIIPEATGQTTNLGLRSHPAAMCVCASLSSDALVTMEARWLSFILSVLHLRAKWGANIETLR
jgi:hypothetical protein